MQCISRLSCIGLRIRRLARPVRLYLFESCDAEGMRIGYEIALQSSDDPVPVLCETWLHEHGVSINNLPLTSYSEIGSAQQAFADFANQNVFESIISEATKPAMVLPYIGTREDLLAFGRDLTITDVRPAFMARRADEAFECLVADKSGKQQALLRVVTSLRIPYEDFLLFQEVPNMTCDRDTWLTWLACDLSLQGWEVFWSDGYSVSVSNVTINEVDDDDINTSPIIT